MKIYYLIGGILKIKLTTQIILIYHLFSHSLILGNILLSCADILRPIIFVILQVAGGLSSASRII